MLCSLAAGRTGSAFGCYSYRLVFVEDLLGHGFIENSDVAVWVIVGVVERGDLGVSLCAGKADMCKQGWCGQSVPDDDVVDVNQAAVVRIAAAYVAPKVFFSMVGFIIIIFNCCSLLLWAMLHNLLTI